MTISISRFRTGLTAALGVAALAVGAAFAGTAVAAAPPQTPTTTPQEHRVIPQATRPIPGTVTASAQTTGHAPAAAVDDDPMTYWQAGTGPAWLQVDLGRQVWVTSVRQTFAQTGVWSFTVQGSLDGTHWVGLVDRNAGASGVVFAQATSGVYRYVRLEVAGSETHQRVSSREFSVLGSTDGSDLAADPTRTTAAASSHAADFPAANAVDANTSTSWQGSTRSKPQWLQLDLGEPVLVTSIRQDFAVRGTWSFTLTGSLDGTSWTTLGSWAKTPGQSFTAPVQRQQFRYVRLTVTGSSGPAASSSGLQVVGFRNLGTASKPRWADPQWRNLAIGVPVTTSSNAGDGWEPELGNDGKTGTFWLAENASMPQTFTADLGNLSLLKSVGFTVHDTDTWKFSVSASTDGSHWTTLKDASAGVRGKQFTVKASGLYRWIRITQTGSAANHWANVGELDVQGYGSPVTTRWFDTSGSVFRYFPKDAPYTKLSTIKAALPGLRRQGYTAIEVAPPYKGANRQGEPDYFAGLGATDNYAIDPHIGTMADWTALLARAHALGMRVIMFENLGYGDISAPAFRKALADFKAGVNSTERGWFVLSDKSGGNGWYQDEATGVWYYAFWGVHDPTYNWKGTWPAEAKKILEFWCDTGIDGMGMDAPSVYYGITQPLNNTVITQTLNNFGLSTMPEGTPPISAPDDIVEQTEMVSWVRDWHYTTIQDLWISHWGNPAYDRITYAIDDQDASTLDAAFAVSRDAVAARGGITVSSASWPLDYDGGTQQVDPTTQRSVPNRLLEASVLTSMGTLNYLINAADWIHPDKTPAEIPSWTAAQKAAFQNVYRAQASYAALGQTGDRIGLPTGSDSALSYLRHDKTGSVGALVVQNYLHTSQTITVDLANSGVATGQTPVDLLTGKAGPRIDSTSYTITLPAYGYAELGVR